MQASDVELSNVITSNDATRTPVEWLNVRAGDITTIFLTNQAMTQQEEDPKKKRKKWGA